METDGGGWTGLTDVVTELDGCDGLTGANTTQTGACEIEGTTATMEIGAPGSWQEVRARVELRVKGTLDAFGWNHQPDSAKLADTYVDGASLSIGTSVHLHTWAVGFGLETNGARNARCPVDGGREAPSFVGTDYLCEGHANRGSHWNDSTYFGDVIVTRTLEEPTDEDLLFRLMRDEVPRMRTFHSSHLISGYVNQVSEESLVSCGIETLHSCECALGRKEVWCIKCRWKPLGPLAHY